MDRGWSGVWVGCWYHSSKHPTMRLQHASYPDCFTGSVRTRRSTGLMGSVVHEYLCPPVTVSGSSWEHAGCSSWGTLVTINSDCPHWQRRSFFLLRFLWMIQLNHKDSICSSCNDTCGGYCHILISQCFPDEHKVLGPYSTARPEMLTALLNKCSITVILAILCPFSASAWASIGTMTDEVSSPLSSIDQYTFTCDVSTQEWAPRSSPDIRKHSVFTSA